jgi:hypothetical protein
MTEIGDGVLIYDNVEKFGDEWGVRSRKIKKVGLQTLKLSLSSLNFPSTMCGSQDT